MTFPTTAYGLALVGAFVVTFVATPLWRRWCERIGLVDDPGHRKIHHQPVALAGGLSVFTGLVLVVLAGIVAIKLQILDPEAAGKFEYGFGRRSIQLAAIVGGAFAMGFLGWWDDRHELRPVAKLLGQAFIAGAVAAAGVRVTLFVPSLFFSYGITVLWILTVTNAVNFNDNMNGLCGGLGAIAAAGFAWHAVNAGQYLVATLAFLVVGALLGFLPYNFPRATVFLGDAGSHLVGFLLAILAILPQFFSPEAPTPSRWAVVSPLLLLSVPLADLVSVIWIRTRMRKPFWIGDNNHFSHRLVRAGFSRTQAVLLLWLAAAVTGLVTFVW